MANVTPLVRNTTRGYPANVAPGDTIVAPSFKGTGVGGVAFDASGNQITGLPAVQNADDQAVSFKYLNDRLQGFHAKAPARTVVTTNVNISSPGTTLGGVTMVAGDRVLLAGQTTASQNGIYIWNGSATPMTRAPDADTNGDLIDGNTIWIQEGTEAGSLWQLTTDGTINIGTTAITWTKFSGLADVTVGNGLSKAGNQIDLVLDGTTLIKSASGLKANVGTGSGQVAAGNHTHADLVPITRQVNGGAGLTAGGALSGNITLAVELTPTTSGLKFDGSGASSTLAVDFGTGANQVARGNHTHPYVSIDTKVLGGAGLTSGGPLSGEVKLEVELTPTTSGLKFDGSGDARTLAVDFGTGTNQVARGNHTHPYVPLARTVTAGFGLSGGGALSGDITLEVNAGNGLEFLGEAVAVKPSTFITVDSDGVSVNIGKGLMDADDNIEVKVDGTSIIKTAGVGADTLAVNTGHGMTVDASGLTLLPSDDTIVVDIGGVKVGQAPQVVSYIMAGEALAAGDIVCVNTADGKGWKARADTEAKANVLGVCLKNTAVNGSAPVATHGEIPGVLLGGTAGQEYFLASAGGITASIPTTGRQYRIGFKGVSNFYIDRADFGSV